MVSNHLLEFFGKVPIFAGLTPDELNDLLRCVAPVQVPAGQALFRQDEPGDAAYVVERGSLEVIVAEGTAQVRLATLGAGAVVGELSLLDGSPRSAGVRALEACSLFRIDKKEFDFLRRNLRPAAFKVIRTLSGTLCERLRATNDELVMVLAPLAEKGARKPAAPASTAKSATGAGPKAGAPTASEATESGPAAWLFRLFGGRS